jgi:glycosyltransferase involved in cell wall biosynthesis
MIGGAGPDIGGDDSYYRGIRAQAAALPNVEFKGFLPLAQADSYFDRARVFVNTSTYEGMPNTFMQAWARGVPTVATVDAGARWRGEPLYPVTQDMDRFAGELERLFTDEVHRARMASRCRDYFNATHASSAVLELYERVFEDVMRGPVDAGSR